MSLSLRIFQPPECGAMVRARVKQVLNRWLALKVAAFLLNDLWWGVRLHFGQIETSSGTTHSSISIGDSLRYMKRSFATKSTMESLRAFEELSQKWDLATMRGLRC